MKFIIAFISTLVCCSWADWKGGGNSRFKHECSKDLESKEDEHVLRQIANYGNKPRNVTIGLLSSFTSNKLILGALPLAVESVNSDPSLLPDVTLGFKAADVGVSEAALSIRKMTEMRDSQVWAFVGPDDNCANEALVAAAWNMPMITYKCKDVRVSNKTQYPTFARTLPPAAKVVKALIAILKKYNWRRFVLLRETSTSYTQIAEAVKVFAKHYQLNISQEFEISHYYAKLNYSIVEDIVVKSFQTTRIYVLLASYEAQWDFVMALGEKAGHSLTQYAVITVDNEKYDISSGFHRLRVVYDEVHNLTELVHSCFRTVLKVTPTHPTSRSYRKFEEKVLEQIRHFPFCVPHNPTVFKHIQVPIYAAHLYDSVKIYAQALTEVLQTMPLADPRDGALILSKIKNRDFPSIQGSQVHMDENGDAEGQFSLLTITRTAPDDTGGVPLGWRSTGDFRYDAQVMHDIDKLPTLHLSKSIPWLLGSPPSDQPPCGFDGCRQDWESISIGFSAILVFAGLAFLVFKHYRYEQKLACLLWKIDMKEVLELKLEGSGIGKKRIVLPSEPGLTSGTAHYQMDLPRFAFCRIGVHKGNLVAIKDVGKKSVDITRGVRKELQQMRDVRHENLLPFVGASVDTGAVCILMAYCARGSLVDVLYNNDLQIDDIFLASLVADLIRGMIFLHESEIGSHGDLCTCNCLVDSRWVLQISGFGLHEFKGGRSMICNSRKQLWTAPELLRCRVRPEGTQKGDVYSFGIVLYETVGRNGPWGSYGKKLSSQEIIRKLTTGEEPHLRPPLEEINASDPICQCLVYCWSENPEDRPDFKTIRIKLKDMHSGVKLNIVDNMLTMMEKYAYGLEAKVEERTQELLEEKKKTEALLLRMLPRSVAESLILGQPVAPESFDSVTIYFSDIVGFTELSAESTPLQIVNLLNGLYTRFDAIITGYDVYKVETIGDAYMVVSGLPIRNADKHATEIASMALELLHIVKKFPIEHKPSETIKLRIGIHTGPCVAGVVGLTMPRYCLFGDTVNTAARMESTGLPLQIHVSQENKNMLEKTGRYIVEERGMTFLKGKGEMRTWWLLDEVKQTVNPVSKSEFDKSSEGFTKSHIIPLFTEGNRNV